MVDIVAATTFGDAWDAAVRGHGDHPFLVYLDPDGTRSEFSYAAFDDRVSRTGRALAGLGIGPGTVVALQIGNSPEFLSCFLALAKLGAVAVPAGLTAPAAELTRLYQACGAEWAIVEAESLDVNSRLKETGVLTGGVLAVHGGGEASLEARLAAEPPGPLPAAAVGGDAVAELMFTSGTTAAPKAVMVTHANLVYSGHYAVWQASLRGDDRIFTTMPACHSNFQLVALTGAIVAGATLVLCGRYSASRFWKGVRSERATVLQLTAMMVRTLLVQPPDPADAQHHVRETLYFMPLSDEDKQAFEDRFAVRLMNSYGSTESICWAVTDPPVGERRWPSVGRAGLGYEVAIMDDEGHELPPGTPGEFWIKGVRGRTLMAGYHGDTAATAAALTTDGWLRTNDVGYVDAEGWFYFTDRARNIIKRAGVNISATEIEAVLETHPGIAEAAVVGVPDPVRDEAVKAFVRPEAGAELSSDDVIAHCCDHLAEYKIPQFIEFVTDFPRTDSMKIAKRELYDRSTTIPAPAGQ